MAIVSREPSGKGSAERNVFFFAGGRLKGIIFRWKNKRGVDAEGGGEDPQGASKKKTNRIKGRGCPTRKKPGFVGGKKPPLMGIVGKDKEVQWKMGGRQHAEKKSERHEQGGTESGGKPVEEPA